MPNLLILINELQDICYLPTNNVFKPLFFREPFGHFKETFGQNKAAEGDAVFRFPLHFLPAVDAFLILRALPLECVSCVEQLGLVLPER